MIASAKAGKHSLIELYATGQNAVLENEAPRSSWFGLRGKEQGPIAQKIPVSGRLGVGTFWPAARQRARYRSFALGSTNGKSARLCDLSRNCRLRRLDPCCGPKLERARLLGMRGPDPCGDWAPERFRRLLDAHHRGRRLVAATLHGGQNKSPIDCCPYGTYLRVPHTEQWHRNFFVAPWASE
jgi:hypothetical protein